MIEMKPIGTIHTPHLIAEKTPIQPVFAETVRGQVCLDEEYAEGLLDLEHFSHVILIYHFDRARQENLRVKPFLQDEEHGVFATRAPNRPNRIGFSVVRLLSIEGTTLHVEDVDILDGTPLLDIKPYIARFDSREETRSGWQDKVSEPEALRLGRRGYALSPGSSTTATT